MRFINRIPGIKFAGLLAIIILVASTWDAQVQTMTRSVQASFRMQR